MLKLGFSCRGLILCVKSRKVIALGSSSRFFLFTLVVVQNVPWKNLMGVQVVVEFCCPRNVSSSLIATGGVTPCSTHSSCAYVRARARTDTHTHTHSPPYAITFLKVWRKSELRHLHTCMKSKFQHPDSWSAVAWPPGHMLSLSSILPPPPSHYAFISSIKPRRAFQKRCCIFFFSLFKIA